MPNHDFQVGDRVYTLADPSFGRPIKILEGIVESKWTSPRGDEFAYDIRHANGIVYGNIPGIFVHDSLEALHGAITCNLESAVENADMSVSYYTRHLETAKRDKARLQRMLQEWRQEVRGCRPDAQTPKEIPEQPNNQ